MASNNNNDLTNNDNDNNNQRGGRSNLRRSQLNPKAIPFVPRARSITQQINPVTSLPGNFQAPMVYPDQLNRLNYPHIQNSSMIQPEGLDMVSPPISPGVNPYWFHFGFPHYPQSNTYSYPPNPQAFYNNTFTPSVDPISSSSLNMFPPLNSSLPSVLQVPGNQFGGLGAYPSSNRQYAPNRLFPLKSNVSQDSELAQDLETESILSESSQSSINPNLETTSNLNKTTPNITTNLATIPETPDTKATSKSRVKTSRASNTSEAEHRETMCPFEGCGRPFKRPEHLKRHFMSIHNKEKPHRCPFPGCGKCFSRNDNLTQHTKSHNKQGSQHRKRNFTK